MTLTLFGYRIRLTIESVLIRHKFEKRMVFIDNKPTELADQCGAIISLNLNSNCFGEDYCNQPRARHIK